MEKIINALNIKLILFFILTLTSNIYANTTACNKYGTIIYSNATYTGECKNNTPHGNGILKAHAGESYEGMWSDGVRDGYGTLTYENGKIKYSGEWHNNKFNGEGTYYFKDRSTYSGQFKDGIKDGYGVSTYTTGKIKYDGEWQKNHIHGHGTYNYKDGSSYTGDFKNDKKDGIGLYTYTVGTFYDGEWRNNKINGYGTYRYEDFSSYTGEFKDGKRDGSGILTDEMGKVKYDGEWHNNKINGYGTYNYDDGSTYTGQFKNDKRDGEGVLTTQYERCEGIWKSNKQSIFLNQNTYAEAYSHYNFIRQQAGMSYLKQNNILQLSAQNHSQYIEYHDKDIKGIAYHNEKPNTKYFTGVSVVDRAKSQGYLSNKVGEGIAGQCIAVGSLNALMTAIYHRFDILTLENDEVGIGFTQDEYSTARKFVHNIGNSTLNELCEKSTQKPKKYYTNVCKDSSIKIESELFQSAINKVKKANPKYVIWPANNSSDNLYKFSGEIPDPIPDYKKTGNPISIEFNTYYFPKNVQMKSFKLYENTNHIKNVRILTKENDPNKIFTDHQFALFALDVLQRDTTYWATFTYIYNGDEKSIKWSFHTLP